MTRYKFIKTYPYKIPKMLMIFSKDRNQCNVHQYHEQRTNVYVTRMTSAPAGSEGP